jgi:ribosomal-protein-alanine N-acetyltransferase
LARGESDADYTRRQIARAAESERTAAAWRRAAFDHSGQLVGIVNLVSIERGLCWHADMNWWVRSDRTRQGLATEMVAAALAHAFADMPFGLGLARVHAGIHPENAASRRVAEKCGFRRDGSLVSKLLINGTWQTHEAFAASAAT